MLDWAEFFAAFVVFIASHALTARPAIKSRLVAVTGPRGFTLFYSLLSIVLLGWLIAAAGRAPMVVLWSREPWQAWVPLTVNAVAAVIVALAVARPNPLSFGGARDAAFDPASPGIVGWMRHPLLVAIGLWAAAHVVPNGDLAHVILFGTFVAFALAGMKIIDRRKRRLLGEEHWKSLAATARPLTVTPGGALRVVIGLAVYALLLWLHPLVIGVSPLP